MTLFTKRKDMTQHAKPTPLLNIVVPRPYTYSKVIPRETTLSVIRLSLSERGRDEKKH